MEVFGRSILAPGWAVNDGKDGKGGKDGKVKAVQVYALWSAEIRRSDGMRKPSNLPALPVIPDLPVLDRDPETG
jgi:hypothetical protein